MLLSLMQELVRMINFLLSILGFINPNAELKKNMKQYETNREIHSNKKNRRRVKN